MSIGITLFQMTVVTPFSSEYFSLLSYEFAIIVEIFMYCWFGNEIEEKSTNIPYAAFESDWVDASKESKGNMIIFMMRCQRPLQISALNLFYLSVETFIKILRAAWSYFTLLYQMSTRK
ncbi:odorant receptor Or2-like [Tribolium madens]|uniref:odorant receptor Or2-like n=1 Tax=Tribolium madens TaxID=41895 RepID=UPI001CF73799|nr:odorant receptor Or2-like [Tribolium madens]